MKVPSKLCLRNDLLCSEGHDGGSGRVLHAHLALGQRSPNSHVSNCVCFFHLKGEQLNLVQLKL